MKRDKHSPQTSEKQGHQKENLYAMRKRFEPQRRLGSTPISEVEIPEKSRDELAPILRALQYIFVTEELQEEVFRVLEAKVKGGKKETGRNGMELWQIMVIGVVRLGLDADYDRLEDMVNHHSLIRQIMGVDTVFGRGKKYSLQSIRDNVRLLDEETLGKINDVVVKAGQRLAKNGREEKLRIKTDTYVVEANVHFPTDMNLLWDAGRKCLDGIEAFIEGGVLNGKGWRKIKNWRKELKRLMRSSSKAASGGGNKKEEAVKKQVKEYLGLAKRLSGKIGASIIAVYEKILTTGAEEMQKEALESMEYFYQMLEKHRDLVERRIIKEEQIPVGEKVYSLFEPHTEWLSKGKANKRVELGHNLVIASDQWGFIGYYQVVEKEADVALILPLADKLLNLFGEEGIESISADKGFYKKEYKELISLYIPKVILPKKGKRNKAETEEESESTFKKLRHKHSAVESDINRLEHHGLDRCLDKGIEGFKRYCALGVLAANLHTMGSILQKKVLEKKEIVRKAA